MASSDAVAELVEYKDLEANELEDKPMVVRTRMVISNERIIPAPVAMTAEPATIVVAPASSFNSRPSPSSQGPSLSRFYPGDVVLYKEDRKLTEWMPLFGTVLNPSPGSEMERSPDKGAANEFHVHWDFTNRITMTSRPTVSIVDRVLLRGQRVENRNGDVGTVVDYEIAASVLINGTEKVVKNVPLTRLQPISPHVRGQEVLLKGWVGVITSIKRNVWFRMDGGVIFHMEVEEADGFSRVDPYWGLGVACPGMRTQLPASAFKRAKWLTKPAKFFNSWLPLHRLYAWNYCTITRTEIVQVEVKWLQQAPGTPDNMAPPNNTVTHRDLNDLVVIGTPSSETVGINSVRKLQISPTDEIIKYNYWLEGFKNKFVDEVAPMEYPTIKPTADPELQVVVANAYTETPVKVLLRHNVVTVQWEDGSLEKIPAIELPKISLTVDDGEFPMGLAVAPIDKNIADGDKYGIVMASIDLAKSRSRKVNVRWIVEGRDQGIEEVAIFDIRPHHVYSLYHRGTIVFPRTHSTSLFTSAVVTDLNVNAGRMVVKISNDNRQYEVYPHQVTALATRCHWSFFAREWILDHMIPPTYQLDLEFNPLNKLLDVSEQKWDVLSEDTNNPPSEDSSTIPTIWDEAAFDLLAFAPATHRYYNCSKYDVFGRGFAQTVAKEMEVLKEKGNVPEGIWIRCYENRLDLLSVLMVGPTKTPYEDGLFLFDIQLTADFPASCPSVHYVSYTHEIHPLLSFDGNVCVSQLSWTPSQATNSYISLFLSRLQSVIFTPSPFFAHPSVKLDETSEHGQIKARMYNQNVYVRVLDSLWNMLQKPHAPWERSIRNHFASAMPEKYLSVEKWINGDSLGDSYTEEEVPSYPLLPVPDGLRSAVLKRIEKFKKLLSELAPIVAEARSVTDATADSESFEVYTKEPTPPPPQTPPLDDARLLTPIAEMTEPSSTSTFGAKLSNITVTDTDDTDHPERLDSMKNVKYLPNKHEKAIDEQPEDEDGEDGNRNETPAAEI